MAQRFSCKAKIWVYPGANPWRFVTVGKKVSALLRKKFGHQARGFGSLPITVTVGKTTWDTSVFFDSNSGHYLLPVKASVRQKEKVAEGDVVQVGLRVRL